MARLRIRVLSVLAAACLVMLALVVNPDRAEACSCKGITTTTAYRSADVVFVGNVIAANRVARRSDARTDLRFAVDRVYKGTAYREQVVASPIGSDGCGLAPQVGTDWVIFATEGIEGSGNQAVSRLITTLCSGNIPTRATPGVLGQGRNPLPGNSDRDERAEANDAAVSQTLKVLGLGGLGAVCLVGLALGLIWRSRRPT